MNTRKQQLKIGKVKRLILLVPLPTIKKYNQFGIIFSNFIIIVKAFGKCISKAFFFVKPTNIFSAAYSGDLIIGIGNLFLSVIGVFMKPGLITDTLTLYLLKSK